MHTYMAVVLFQMRTVANDIIKEGGAGEWSMPALVVTIPPQPAPISEEGFSITSFMYRYVLHVL